MLSAPHETGCGQVKVADKSNENRAARELLRSMQLFGCVVDAMHAQVETIRLILDGGADYDRQGQDDTRRTESNRLERPSGR